MDLKNLKLLSPEALQQLLPAFLSGFVKEGSEVTAAALQALVKDWTDEERQAVHQGLTTQVAAGEVQWAVKQCCEVSRTWCDSVIRSASVRGMENLVKATETGPTLILSSHLSYFDASATDAIIAEAAKSSAEKLVFAAGPKVYQSLFRRVAAAGLNTMPVPQSNRLAHTTTIPAREFAQLVRASLDTSRTLMENGSVLLLYPEGSRSRSGRLGPFIAGVHRYLNIPGLSVVPLGITGTQAIMPVGARGIYPGSVSLAFGEPIRVTEALPSRPALLECHRQIARLLPPTHAPPTGQAQLA
jgi:1-acyl-sn-glycerol-3-phosphate acyltransferase